MITININQAAKDFIKKSLKNIGNDKIYLRIAVYPDDTNYNYGIGFDQKNDHDIVVKNDVIDIVILDKQQKLLNGTTLDYVKINNEMNLIILNPNDPSFVPPEDHKKY